MKKEELENIKAVMDLFLSQKGEPVSQEAIEWELDFRSHLFSEVEKVLAEQREELRKELEWVFTPHEYESDDPLYQRFALQLKEKYKKITLSLLTPPNKIKIT